VWAFHVLCSTGYIRNMERKREIRRGKKGDNKGKGERAEKWQGRGDLEKLWQGGGLRVMAREV
jgi:hypothetical protein